MKEKVNAPDYKLKKNDIERLIRYATVVPSKAAEAKREIKKNIITAIVAAFGFIIALVWRDAIKEAVDKLVEVAGLTGSGYLYTILTAVIITVVCVIGIMVFSTFSEKKD
jgi:uncharacterized membrane protein